MHVNGNEAQTAAAILGHNYPDSVWYKDTYTLLQTKGLEPRESTDSWMSKAFKSFGLGESEPVAAASGGGMMLVELSIRDIVLIDKLDLDFTKGLAVLTGETGAGKSILLDALGLALGDRADSGLVRQGCTQASVTASTITLRRETSRGIMRAPSLAAAIPQRQSSAKALTAGAKPRATL